MRLVNWEAALPLMDQMSVLRVYTTIVSYTSETFYSTNENRSKIAWRWQMSPNTVKYAIAQLAEKNFLKREGRGVYKVNKDFLINVEMEQAVS
jgi:hypothetical protein